MRSLLAFRMSVCVLVGCEVMCGLSLSVCLLMVCETAYMQTSSPLGLAVRLLVGREVAEYVYYSLLIFLYS